MPKPVKPNFDNKYFYTTDSFVTLEIESDVVPKSDNTVSLGSSTNRWANIYTINGRFDGILRGVWQNLEVIYVSPTGGGDGSSPSNPTTLNDALTRAKARNVIIYLLDGEYHISKNYVIACDRLEIKSYNSDPSLCKIVFDTYADTNANYSYSIRILKGTVKFTKVTLENAPKVDTTLPWSIGGGAFVPIEVGGDTLYDGVLILHSCVINQSRDYFVSCKHSGTRVIFSGTTINMSGDAVAFINNDFGVVLIGWYASSITSGYKLTTGVQGRDVLFSGNINAISTSQTWFEYGLPSNVIPSVDNTYNLGSSTKRWAKGWFVNLDIDGTIQRPDSGTWYKTDNSHVLITHHDGWGNFQIMCGGTPWGGAVAANFGYAEIEMDYEYVNGIIKFNVAPKVANAGDSFTIKGVIVEPWNLRPTHDNTFNLGTSTLRWANVYCVNLYTGDIKLMNDWVITERDENDEIIENGVRILNKNGEEIFKITEDGIYFKGKKIKLLFEE